MEQNEKSRILEGDPKEQHIVSYREHFGTWLALIILTAMTILVSVTGISLVAFSVITALAIASTKATAVALYFMHLNYDNKIYKIMLGTAMLLFLSFLLLTAIDYIYR